MILILGQFSEKCYDANLDIYHIHGTEFICANYGEKVEWAPFGATFQMQKRWFDIGLHYI